MRTHQLSQAPHGLADALLPHVAHALCILHHDEGALLLQCRRECRDERVERLGARGRGGRQVGEQMRVEQGGGGLLQRVEGADARRGGAGEEVREELRRPA